ncbi:hypothetical protein [Nocardia sp. NPDC060259]|uniref:hypothetical protein n=1 Tax=Nocardia sp. NPDC060259 TaxID=3347088 RepID=UPI00364DEADC
MDRPDAHRPTGARQHDPGSAGDPFTAATPWRPGRELGAPRPRRLTETTGPQPVTGPRHRIDGPATPAGIPVISLSAARAPERIGQPDPLHSLAPADSYATDRLPIVGGPFDPGARHALPDPPMASPEPDNGPNTDRLPIIAPAPEGTWADWVTAEQEPAPRPTPDYSGDDEVFARMIDRSRRRRRPPRWAAPLAASMAGALLIGGGYYQLRGPAPESAAASTVLEPAPASTVPVAGDCPAEQVGSKIQGNGAGGTENGVAAILAFQHAYYVARSGDQARTLVSGDAALPSGADIQAGIDTIPVGTTHCLSITPAAFAGQYFVVITEFRPDSAPIIYNPQLVGTAKVGGKTLITSIGPVR